MCNGRSTADRSVSAFAVSALQQRAYQHDGSNEQQQGEAQHREDRCDVVCPANDAEESSAAHAEPNRTATQETQDMKVAARRCIPGRTMVTVMARAMTPSATSKKGHITRSSDRRCTSRSLMPTQATEIRSKGPANLDPLPNNLDTHPTAERT